MTALNKSKASNKALYITGWFSLTLIILEINIINLDNNKSKSLNINNDFNFAFFKL